MKTENRQTELLMPLDDVEVKNYLDLLTTEIINYEAAGERIKRVLNNLERENIFINKSELAKYLSISRSTLALRFSNTNTNEFSIKELKDILSYLLAKFQIIYKNQLPKSTKI